MKRIHYLLIILGFTLFFCVGASSKVEFALRKMFDSQGRIIKLTFSDGTSQTSASGDGGAPTAAKYITQTPDATLPNEQALSSLGTGIMKNTTGTGIVSIAVQGTDYYSPGGTNIAIADGGTGSDTAQAAINILTNVAAATNEHVLTKDTGTGDAKWKAATGGFADPMTTRGDIIIRNASNATDRLGLGISGKVLKSDGSDIYWGTDVAGSGAWGISDPITLGTTTYSVVIGAAQKNTSKFTIDGDANVIQMTIQGDVGQTENYLTVEKSDGTDLVTISSTGTITATAIDTSLSNGQTGYVRLREDPANGTNFVALEAPASIASDVTWTLPSADGSGAFISNGSGTVSLTAVATSFGRSLTLSGNSADADAELYTDAKTLWFENPVATDDFKTIWVAPVACTITKIHAESDQTVNFDLQIDDGTPAGVNGSDITTAGSFVTDSSLAGDTTMAAGERLDLAITSVSGTPTWFSVTWEFTYDD